MSAPEAHRRLQAHCTELEERIMLCVNAIQILSTERATDAKTRTVTDIASRRTAPR